ncbi:aspartoacylase [Nodosilinea sp. PGN35]|uniref:aspartoacylase n=1 Tax=Nodosilinea sp. PGN35 TaxID=3020489 RepID=UPI0023B2AAE5|nr:aspartoacylase [Nodosilinea sp. TSF1-S3]MDF0366080.1 aspartoacylase [Nodosilinea sp. TSF1-S3]
MGTIRRVLIVGGTHGNELTGVYTVQHYQASPELVRRSSFETVMILGNPRAIAAGRRYIDYDLNRSFDAHSQTDSGHYEVQRAEALRAQFGPAGTAPADVVLDLHSTTANAGVMVILDQLDSFTLALAAHLKRRHPEIRFYCSEGSGRGHDSLRSLAPYRLCIEVGPIAHGTLQADLFHKTTAILQTTLDYLDHHNQGTSAVAPPTDLVLYRYSGTLDYPRTPQGDLLATIHPHRQGQDYAPLAPGDPLFLTFAGMVVPYSGSAVTYPVFINEAAYYEKGIALCTTQKQQISVAGGNILDQQKL